MNNIKMIRASDIEPGEPDFVRYPPGMVRRMECWRKAEVIADLAVKRMTGRLYCAAGTAMVWTLTADAWNFAAHKSWAQSIKDCHDPGFGVIENRCMDAADDLGISTTRGLIRKAAFNCLWKAPKAELKMVFTPVETKD